VATARKPGDETISAAPSFDRPADSFVGAPLPPSGSRPAVTSGVAPEASQGAWRERAFTPRGVMGRDDILRGLESALTVVLASANHPRIAFDEVRRHWLPLLRQALEQAGGNGLDAWLGAVLGSRPVRSPIDSLWADTTLGLQRMRASRDLATFEEATLKTIDQVRQALLAEQPKKLSFKQLERELEGKLEVDDLVLLAASTNDELTRRLGEIDDVMGQLRDELRTKPGQQPDGMYANFVRLKAELRVIGAELKHRQGVTRPPALP
jgi:hypothetical protein